MYAKYPILVWKDAEETFSVATASGSFACARGKELKKCLDDLRKYIIWKMRNDYFERPDFSEPVLETVEISVRTEYEVGSRSFPSLEPIRLSVPYVWGKRDDDSVCCRFPSLDTTFYCNDEIELKRMVASQAEKCLQGKDPADLVNLLAPSNLSVDTLNVRVPKEKEADTEFRSPTLESVCTLLTSRDNRRLFTRNWMRENETSQLVERLKMGSGNLILLGERGVGKTTLMVNAARQIVRESRLNRVSKAAEADDNLSWQARLDARRFWATSADRIVAGMQYLGQWEARAEEIIEELAGFQGVLCFDSLEPLLRIGGRDPVSSLASFFVPYLQNNELRIVVEASPAELDACRRLLPNFESLFQIVEVDAMSPETSRSVLISLGEQFQQQHKVEFEPEAAELCCQLFRRFLPYEKFPGNCVDFWSELFEDAKLEKRAKVTRDNVIDRFIKKTGLPEPLIRDDFCLSSDEVEQFFTSRVVGQPEACKSLTNVMTTFKAGLNDAGRPIGVQLFCGPTGVGKTELSKSLAEYMFGSGEAKDRLVRLDMSEYGGPLAAERLVMQSNGQPSEFINRIREQPLVVVLLDEIEKAAAEVYDVLMGVFDEGRLTDRWGRTTDFRSTVIVMTSNLGVRRTAPVGFDSRSDDGFEAEVKKFFRPEFFNRIDRLIAFHPLEFDSIEKIAELELKKICQREGLEKRNLKLSWTQDAIAHLAKEGFDARLGARPLQRALERMVVTPIARVLAEHPELRDSELICDFVDGKIKFAY